jgi:hypothetical protein
MIKVKTACQIGAQNEPKTDPIPFRLGSTDAFELESPGQEPALSLVTCLKSEAKAPKSTEKSKLQLLKIFSSASETFKRRSVWRNGVSRFS